jgi:hypothetical protein
VLRLWDCFMFREELDLLACRLDQLDGKVRGHVLVESTVTHTGLPKLLHYARSGLNYSHVTHVVVDDMPDHPDPWVREHHQRSATWRGLEAAGADDSDVLLLCDVDEIPSDLALEAAASLSPDRPVMAFAQRPFAFAVDYEFTSYQQCTFVAVLAGQARRSGVQLHQIRDGRDSYPVIRDGGWHFSWLGGPQAIARKTEASCHPDQVPDILDCNARGLLYEQGFGCWGETLYPVEVDETWPRYIRERRCPETWFRPRLRGHRLAVHG